MLYRCKICGYSTRNYHRYLQHLRFGCVEGGEVIKRSLYQCLEAKCREDEEIYCAKGHNLCSTAGIPRATIGFIRLARGEPLEMNACQNCPNYDEMGPPVPKSERGWVDLPKVTWK